MVLSNPAAAIAEEEEVALSEEIRDEYGEVTPTVVPEDTPTPSPAVTEAPEPTQAPSTPTPEPTQAPTATPTPAPTATETPAPTQTPVPSDTVSGNATRVIDRIDALSILDSITLDQKAEVEGIRSAYNSLSDQEKAQVTNYSLFVSMETQLKTLERADNGTTDKKEEKEDEKDKTETKAKEGDPVYYTDLASNLHAGKEFYLNSLQSDYQLSFSSDFAAVMDEIESEYRTAQGLTDSNILVRNWQDILAVYVYEQSQQGVTSYTFDASCKEALAAIFARMNPVIQEDGQASYANYHVTDYIQQNQIAEADCAILNKYTETNCSLLCAIVTAAKGLVRESVGDSVAEERVNVITAAYSLIGKVGYFWGGKSNAIGVDSSWGTFVQVTEEGSRTTGTLRAYGLDCSGFVTWAVINGYQDTGMAAAVGTGTSEQWLLANTVSEADAQPGDLVFQKGPEAGSDNHVGILCGKTDSGDWIAVHCSASQNGVTVGEAYGASFRYIRQPSFYPAAVQNEQTTAESETSSEPVTSNVTVLNPLMNMVLSSSASSSEADTGSSKAVQGSVTVSNPLLDVMAAQGKIHEKQAAEETVFDVIAEEYPPEEEAEAGPSGETASGEGDGSAKAAEAAS